MFTRSFDALRYLKVVNLIYAWSLKQKKYHNIVWCKSPLAPTGLKDLPLITANRHHSLFGHICQLSPEVPATLHWRCHWNSSCTRLETPTWPTTSNVDQARGRGPGATCEHSLDHSHVSVNVEIAMTLS